jgi:hypothetical protein
MPGEELGEIPSTGKSEEKALRKDLKTMRSHEILHFAQDG